MSNTSSAVKRRYNAKVYKDWRAPVKFELFDRLEQARGTRSRAAFLEYLLTQISRKENNEL